jgi:menaquinone-9 beta-reductase
MSDDPRVRIDHALEQFPELRARLAGTAILSSERGAITATRKLPSVIRDRVALIGDASGSVDAITGAGVGLAVQQAVALAGALVQNRPSDYETRHRGIMRPRRIMAETLLAMDRWPRIGEQARRALSFQPRIFDRLLALHVR